MAKINKTKYALLGVLTLSSGSGYDIKKFCDSSIGHFWHENYGHIYPVLKKMEEEGLITKEVQQTEGRPSKNIYSITEEGKKELEEWLMLPVEQEPARSELLLKIFCSKDIPVKNVIEKVRKIKEECEEELQVYSKIKKLLSSNKINKKNSILWISTVNFGMHDCEAKLKWCEETLEALETIKDL
ncbi:PadR family transcriptional regulator [Clostridium sp. JS66]|uniref:PadR family transcriptional regulator n=1 Tax=Clostridium sp. JS66 TaxID=3064705 RepID=UPI00298E7E7A|nr:PadR family transcriptional regulator [Clostridium sp. JS66]WPC44512.1 PadR family transcriptional regulator [Clostridium sp. JS66]